MYWSEIQSARRLTVLSHSTALKPELYAANTGEMCSYSSIFCRPKGHTELLPISIIDFKYWPVFMVGIWYEEFKRTDPTAW